MQKYLGWREVGAGKLTNMLPSLACSRTSCRNFEERSHYHMVTSSPTRIVFISLMMAISPSSPQLVTPSSALHTLFSSSTSSTFAPILIPTKKNLPISLPYETLPLEHPVALAHAKSTGHHLLRLFDVALATGHRTWSWPVRISQMR